MCSRCFGTADARTEHWTKPAPGQRAELGVLSIAELPSGTAGKPAGGDRRLGAADCECSIPRKRMHELFSHGAVFNCRNFCREYSGTAAVCNLSPFSIKH
jgi:hypothetical protein